MEEESVFKVFSVESELSLYLNINGLPHLVRKSENKQDYELIDAQIKRDFLDDVEIPENETIEVSLKRIKRYQLLVNELKTKYGHKCQICMETFLMDTGNYYCEAHHLKMLSQDGSQSPDNVIIVCANHHRKFHYASSLISVGDLIEGKRSISIDDKINEVCFE